MKKLLLFTSLLILSINIFAQNRGTYLDTNARYCLIMATQRISGKVFINVDFGQERKWFKNKTALVDSLGNTIEFNSVIDVLNYMNKKGWEFVDAYSVTVGNSNVLHYLMRKNDD